MALRYKICVVVTLLLKKYFLFKFNLELFLTILISLSRFIYFCYDHYNTFCEINKTLILHLSKFD